MSSRASMLLGCVVLVSGCGDRTTSTDRSPEPVLDRAVPVIGGPCEGCEWVFVGMPDSLTSRSRVAPPDQPGEPMRIEGVVTDAEGRPAPGIIVYAYHTDAHGIYPPPKDDSGPSTRHGSLRGWAMTDDRGHYRFDSIRPASYPDSRVPAHVHMHVIEPGCCTYWIASIEFLDDPFLEERPAQDGEARGGVGIVKPRRDDEGTWVVTRDIVLGQAVDGHARARRDSRS